MAAALSFVGSSVVDSHSSPCLCIKTGGCELVPYKNQKTAMRKTWRPGSLELGSLFVKSWHDWRVEVRALSGVPRTKRVHRDRRLVIVNEVAGQYEDSFEDVKMQILNYFTYKAVKTVLHQLYEMNPTQYTWFYNFVVANKPGDGKRFMRLLVKERQELAERVMVTRLHLYGKWVKKCDHAEIYKEISDENVELMRERLMQTIIWPSDDTNTSTNTETIG